MKKMNTKTFFNWRKAGARSLLVAGLALFSLGSSYGQVLVTADFTGQTLPTGWDTVNVTNDGEWAFDNPGFWTMSNSSSTNFDSDFAIFDSDYWCGNDEDAELVTPSFNANTATGSIILSFDNVFRDYSLGASEAHVEVWNGTTWTDVLTMTGSSDGYPNANHKTIDITNACGSSTAAKVRFHWSNGACDYYWAIDNVKIELITCGSPGGLSVSSITPTTATVSWTASSIGTPTNGYQYYYNTTGSAPTANTTVSGSSATASANLSSLTPNTQYYFWARSICSATDTSDWTSTPAAFKTLCTIDTAPWTYNVESAVPTTTSDIEDCWSSDANSSFTWNIDGSGSTPSSSTGPSGAHSGSNYFYTEASSGYQGDSAFLVSPAVNVSGLTLPALTFYYHMYGQTMGNLYVQVSSDGGATWNTLDSIIGEQQTSDTDPWLKRLVILSGYTTTINIRFVGVRGSDFYGDMSLDDISINQAPSCITPVGLAANNITTTTATIDWDVPAIVPGNGYAYYYNTTGIAPTTNTTASGSATSNSANLTTLTQNSHYYFWVRSMCSSTDTSDWSMVLDFRTPQTPATLPYDDNFTSTGGNWTMLGENQTNQWAAGSATGNTGNSMYVSNDGGTSNAYSTGSISVSQTYRDIVLPAGPNPFDLTFDWAMKGEGVFPNTQWDYFRVWLVPNTYEPTPGTQISAFSSNGQQFGANFNDPNGTGSWHTEHYIIPNTYAGDTIRLVFEWRNDGSGGTQPPAAIDNVNVSIITCLTPGNLTADNITTTTADLNWETPAITPGTGYDYYYNTTGTAPTANTTVSGSATDTFASLSNLTQNTTYYVWVRSVCSSSDKSYWSSTPTIFTTECSTANVPYTVPMATGTPSANPPGLPDCMSDEALNSNDNEGWYTSTGSPGSTYGFSGNYLRSDYTYYGDGSVNNWVYTNKINMTAGTYYKLSFKYGHNSSSTTEKLAVAIGRAATADSMSAAIFDDTTISFAGSKDTNVYFMAPTTDAYYIGFHAHSDEDQYYLFLNNISVDSLPTCYVANSLIANNITTTTANLAWFGTALQYNIEYGPAGFIQGNGTIVTSTTGTYHLTNLNPNTTYDFYVEDVCLPGAITAGWSTAGTFTTLCDTPIVSVGHDTAFCTGGSIVLYTGNTDTGRTVLWSNGSSADSLVINTSGNYYAKVTNQYGCSSTDTVHINVKTYPVINLGNDTTICTGNTVTLNAGTQPFGTTFYWNTTQTTQTIQVSDSGQYKIVADNHGCVSSDSIHISEIAAPNLDGITITQNTDGSYSYSASGVQNAAGLDWDFGDGSSHSSNPNPTHTYTSTGNYTVTLFVSNACGSDSATANIRFIAAGIHQITLDNDQLKMYPNPARDRVILKNESQYKMESVSVYNVLGQEVFHSNTNNQSEYELNVQGLASGMYNIKINFKGGNWISRKFEIRK